MEREAADNSGLTLYELMQRAGEAAFQVARETYSNARYWLVLCGYGNNGSDGCIVARLARVLGLRVTSPVQESDKPFPEEAQQACDAWLNAGGVIHTTDISWPNNVGAIINALSGTGLKRAPRESLSVLIERANSHPVPTVMIDIPSGLLTQTGATPGVVTNTAYTIIFIALRPGLLAGKARDVTGRLHVSILGLDDWPAGQNVPTQRFNAQQFARWLASRRLTSHKDSHGRLAIIGDDHGAAGAVRMTGEAALRAGAGLVKTLTHSENIVPILTARPELMVDALTPQTLEESLAWTDVAVIDPGLGQQEWDKKALQKVENFRRPMLWDADALNLLAINPDERHNHVITPYPGKAARLLSYSTVEIEGDRLLRAQHLVKRYGGVVVLKDTGTAVAAKQAELGIIDISNAGMANGRVGDVLSSITGTSLERKLTPYDVVCAGCVTHGAVAGVLVARFGTCGILATDPFTMLQRIINPDVIDVYHDESSNSAT